MRNFVRKAIHTNSPPLVWPSNFHKIGLFAKKHKTSSKHRIWINFCVKFTPRRRCLGRPTWSLVGPIGRDRHAATFYGSIWQNLPKVMVADSLSLKVEQVEVSWLDPSCEESHIYYRILEGNNTWKYYIFSLLEYKNFICSDPLQSFCESGTRLHCYSKRPSALRSGSPKSTVK